MNHTLFSNLQLISHDSQLNPSDKAPLSTPSFAENFTFSNIQSLRFQALSNSRNQSWIITVPLLSQYPPTPKARNPMALSE
jgi:hypothetical protein